MQANVGGWDRTGRLIVGPVLAIYGGYGLMTTGMTTLNVALPVVGVVLIVTAIVQYCPLNQLVGLNTCPVKAAVGDEADIEDESNTQRHV